MGYSHQKMHGASHIEPEEGPPSPRAREVPPPTGVGPVPARPYAPPRLERYGRLAEITHFGGSQVVDSGTSLGTQT